MKLVDLQLLTVEDKDWWNYCTDPYLGLVAVVDFVTKLVRVVLTDIFNFVLWFSG